MIPYKRPIPAPAVFAEQECIEELEEARRIFSRPGKYKKRIAEFEFRAYARSHRKEPVRALCFGKCAYCESNYSPTALGDVEHFRPKGTISKGGKMQGRGYYWLASAWTNLLPACSACNTRHEEAMAGNPSRQMVGKGNEFPLADERNRAKRPGQEKREKPLLLNPFDRPDVHKFFVFDGEGNVHPASTGSARKPEAVVSIQIYGLQRRSLVKARSERLKSVAAHILNLDQVYRTWRKRPKDKMLTAQLAWVWSEVEALISDDAEYASMARQYVNEKVSSDAHRRIRRAVAAFRKTGAKPIAPFSNARSALRGR